MQSRGIGILLVITSQLWCGGCGGDCEPPAGSAAGAGGTNAVPACFCTELWEMSLLIRLPGQRGGGGWRFSPVSSCQGS